MNGMQLDPATMQRIAMLLQGMQAQQGIPGGAMQNTAVTPPMPPQPIGVPAPTAMMGMGMPGRSAQDPRAFMMGGYPPGGMQ